MYLKLSLSTLCTAWNFKCDGGGHTVEERCVVAHPGSALAGLGGEETREIEGLSDVYLYGRHIYILNVVEGFPLDLNTGDSFQLPTKKSTATSSPCRCYCTYQKLS